MVVIIMYCVSQTSEPSKENGWPSAMREVSWAFAYTVSHTSSLSVGFVFCRKEYWIFVGSKWKPFFFHFCKLFASIPPCRRPKPDCRLSRRWRRHCNADRRLIQPNRSQQCGCIFRQRCLPQILLLVLKRPKMKNLSVVRDLEKKLLMKTLSTTHVWNLQTFKFCASNPKDGASESEHYKPIDRQVWKSLVEDMCFSKFVAATPFFFHLGFRRDICAQNTTLSVSARWSRCGRSMSKSRAVNLKKRIVKWKRRIVAVKKGEKLCVHLNHYRYTFKLVQATFCNRNRD